MTPLAELRALVPLADALIADGPAPEHRDALMLYGQFVGEWELEWTGYQNGAPALTERGEWIFAWILEGRAVQDVWIIPERARRGEPGVPEGEYGTTIRIYDPQDDVWKITWSGPLNGARRTFLGRKEGDEIVQEGERESGEALRWIFSDITATSFRWQSFVSPDDGVTWERAEEMRVRRR